ncbi:MAG: endonuclease/exonuclease/phosphatase family protein [Opitutaceae bacterium]|nr:endonuclease/exonuclease/phosphatase family protein [Opitutaceae bacterium]
MQPRWSGAEDGDNSWSYRKEFCIDVIRSRAPDIICFQEVWLDQLEDVLAAFPGYRHYVMIDDPVGPHPLNCILYQTDAYKLISSGGYWLSEQPHVAGSRSWDSRCVRAANWIRLEERSTKIEFRVVNTHLDHIGQVARENQARLIAEDASAYPEDYPQILTGDMNCDSQNKAIGNLKSGGWIDTYESVHGAKDPGHTFHEFLGPRYESSIGKMDWVFMRGNIEVIDAEVITDSRDGRFPSDHYFITATFDIKKTGL